MSVATKEKKCRIDLRLTSPQRANYETAAELKGQTLSQWSTTNLDAAAQRDIEEVRTTTLSASSFTAFCEMLDAPMPKEAKDLLEHDEIWS